MRAHVNLLGLLQLTWGGMGLLLAASLLLLSLGAAAIARSAPDTFTATFTALLFLTFAAALALGGWANAWTGRRVRQHVPSGRIWALALAVINLFVLPFGTALAIYTFWVLLHDDARAMFEHAPAAH